MRPLKPLRTPLSENKSKIIDAKSAISDGNLAKARQLLLEVTDADSYFSEAWSILAQVVETLDEKITCLENVCFVEENSQVLLYWQALITSQILKALNGDTTPRQSLERVFIDSIQAQGVTFNWYDMSILWEHAYQISGQYFWKSPLNTLSADFIVIQDYQTILFQQDGIFQRHDSHFQTANHLQAFADLTTITKPTPPPKPISHTHWGNHFIHILNPPITASNPLILMQKMGWINQKFLTRSIFLSETPSIEGFIQTCVRSRINMLIIGDNFADTTQLINELSDSIGHDERTITLERFVQYQLSREHVIPLERDTIMHEADDFVLRMRPDRVIFGDLWMADIPYFIQTGLAGVNIMGRLRARTVESALWQFEMALMNTYPELPLSDARKMLSNTLPLVIFVKRLPNGTDKIVEVSEIIRNDADNSIGIHPIYIYNAQTDAHESTDYSPRIVTRFGLDWG